MVGTAARGFRPESDLARQSLHGTRVAAALLLSVAPLALPRQAVAADVRVTISGVRNDKGRVLVAICPRAEFLQDRCRWYGSAPAVPGNVVVVVSGVPAGTYAAQAFHDENGSGKLERTFLGLPKEGLGFSHDAPMHFGPPRFDAAAFTVTEGGAAIAFSLRYF
jgi:uncharacterized protein (DUF2141 family)